VADQNTSTVNNDNLLMSYFERRALKTLQDKVWFYQVAQMSGEIRPIPQGSGTQITFNAWRRLAAASSFLSESSGNAAVSLSSRKVNVSIVSLGRTVKLTDLLEQTSVLNVNEGALRRIEDSAALTIDNALQYAVFKGSGTAARLQVGQLADTKTKILSAWMSSTASSFCANTGTTGNTLQFGLPVVFGTSASRLSAVSATAPSVSARMGPIGVRKAVARLERLNAEPMADGRYVGIMHTNAKATLLGNSDYKQWVLNYTDGPKETMYKNETTPVHNVRFIQSNNVPRFAVAAHSVNLTPIFGQGCLAAVELGGSVKYIITRPGSQSTNDPFWLNSFVAFKVRMIGAILDPSAGVILATSEKL